MLICRLVKQVIKEPGTTRYFIQLDEIIVPG